jgi:peroxiredoxin
MTRGVVMAFGALLAGSVLAAEAPATIPKSPLPSAVDAKTGERVVLDPSQGPMHVMFMATWCQPCLAEIPKLVDLEDRWKADGYRLFLIAVTTRQTPAKLQEFQAKEPLPGRLLFDADGAAAAALGAANIPAQLLIDRKGDIVLRQGTIDPAFKSAVERLIRQEGRAPRP